jgi:hypothetical protein
MDISGGFLLEIPKTRKRRFNDFGKCLGNSFHGDPDSIRVFERAMSVIHSPFLEELRGFIFEII